MPTLDQLFPSVIAEAQNIRKFATEEERARLNMEDLDGVDPKHCVYGMMTGNCFNARSTELLILCAYPFALPSQEEYFIPAQSKSFLHAGTINLRLEGSAIEFLVSRRRYAKFYPRLIAYLRGESDELNFE